MSIKSCVACFFVFFHCLIYSDDDFSNYFLSTTLWDVNGRAVSLDTLKGKNILINFYASWCGGCREEIFSLNSLKNESNKKFEVIGISLDTDTSIVRNFAANANMAYFSFVSGSFGKPLMKSLGNLSSRIPFTVYISKSGAVKFSKLGLLNNEDIKAIKSFGLI